MSAGNERFRKNFSALIRRAGEKAEQVVRVVAGELHKSIVQRSPVGDPDGWQSPAPAGYVGGRFRANWNVELGAIDYRDNFAPDTSGKAALDRGKAKLAAWAPGQTIYITNSLPYADRLEHGWSKQAPRGMVRLTVLAYANALRETVKNLP
jgi:hypothetical protein